MKGKSVLKIREHRFLLEYRFEDQLDWIEGSSFDRLDDALDCLQATLFNLPDLAEGRVFDCKLQAFRFYRAAYPFIP